jgi:diguanylate cyclase (GGDEF)-like protein
MLVSVALAVSAAAAGYLVLTSSRAAREAEVRETLRLASMLADTTGVLLSESRNEDLRVLLEETTDGSRLRHAVVLDADRRIVVSAVRQGTRNRWGAIGAPMTDDMPVGLPVLRAGFGDNPSCWDVLYPIHSIRSRPPSTEPQGDHLLGYVRLGVPSGRLDSAVQRAYDFLIGVGLLGSGLAIPLAYALVRRVLRPVEELCQTMERFSEGRLETRSQLRRRDEFGALAMAFNRMADQYEATHRRLVRFNAELEERVVRRTRQLRELVAREPLTGLYNRRHFKEVLQRSVSEARRYGKDLTCVMMDMDSFKQINDAYGHQVGDEVLLLAASTIARLLRSSDIAARYGGDEFILLLPQTDCCQATVLARRILQALQERLRGKLPDVQTSISIGIASLNRLSTPDADSLVRAADLAMYQAKEAGGSTIQTAPAERGGFSEAPSLPAEGYSGEDAHPDAEADSSPAGSGRPPTSARSIGNVL